MISTMLRSERKRDFLGTYPGAAANSLLVGDTWQVADDVSRNRLTKDHAINMATMAVDLELIPACKFNQLKTLLG